MEEKVEGTKGQELPGPAAIASVGRAITVSAARQSNSYWSFHDNFHLLAL